MSEPKSTETEAAVTVHLAPALLTLFPDAPSRVAVTASTVDALIDALDVQWPGMADRLRDTTPAVRRHINVFVDGERASLATSLKPQSEIFILTAISGG